MENTEIYKAFIEFQKECPKLQLNSTVNVKLKSGGQYNFKYADLTTIHDTVKPLLTKQELGFTQLFDGHSIITLLIHSSGQTITSSFDISHYLNGTNPQDAGGVITYFKRYSLSAILGLTSEEDDDANAAMGNEAKKTTIPKKPKTKLSDALGEMKKCETLEEVKKCWTKHNEHQNHETFTLTKDNLKKKLS